MEWYNEIQEVSKEKQKRRRRPNSKSVAETTSNSSTVTTNCSQAEVGGIKKLKPRRKVSAVVPMENQGAPN